ncbi:MAG: hypothetical protein HZC41_19345 [Chloroflexi bacterium]|nr:hypothetical protein [Chloroflexota bacterium]
MSYLRLFLPQHLAVLSDWLVETGELYVDIYWPHSGNSGSAYFVRSMKELRDLVVQQTWPEICFTIFRRLQYSIRGVANEQLLEQALRRIPDGQWFRIVSLDDYYPSQCAFRGSGNSHQELRNEFAGIVGEEVGIGQDPFDVHDEKWFSLHSDEVFLIRLSRNHNRYEAYAQHPDQYKWLEDLWYE